MRVLENWEIFSDESGFCYVEITKMRFLHNGF